jgi:hypothetical protein
MRCFKKGERMAIQFQCPSCGQPIEIDDEWAGQEVSCPFCRKVVTAPANSTWHATRIPQAAPLVLPPPPFGVPGDQLTPTGVPLAARRTKSFAMWACLLSATGWLLLIVTMMAGARVLSPILEQVHDPSLDVGQQQQRLIEAVQKETARNPKPFFGMAVASMTGLGCLMGALVVSIVGLTRREMNVAVGIGTIILSVLPLFCVCLSTIGQLAMPR